ncbi:MAG: hypothetical protein HXY34_06700 [Candidatus Thorarchaeota archaeon]|nr:hypothetical protein [Candidatus Thorarchaeota archaeon]
MSIVISEHMHAVGPVAFHFFCGDDCMGAYLDVKVERRRLPTTVRERRDAWRTTVSVLLLRVA